MDILRIAHSPVKEDYTQRLIIKKIKISVYGNRILRNSLKEKSNKVNR